MPRIYIDGIYIGGINELEALSDCGDLRIRLQHFSKYQDRKHCQYCLGVGKVVCKKCNGKRVRLYSVKVSDNLKHKISERSCKTFVLVFLTRS